MAVTPTDSYTLDITDEDDPNTGAGTLSGDPWLRLMPNTIGTFGIKTKTVAREPISEELMPLADKIVDLDSGVGLQADIDWELLWRMLPNSLFAMYKNAPSKGPQNGYPLYPTSVTTTEYVVPALGDLPAGTLVFAAGFAKAANNGFKTVGAASTGTAVKVSGLAAETCDQPQQNAQLWVCGVQGDSADITITAGGGTVTLGSTTLDFTTLGWSEGQEIRVGGTASNTFFATAADNGYARIASGGLAAHAVVLDMWGTTPVTDAGVGKTIQLFFGPFISNVAKSSALYKRDGLRVQAKYDDLGGVGVPMYKQAQGNWVDQANVEMPLTNKGGLNFTLVGTDTLDPSGSAAAGSDDSRTPVLTDDYNTSSEIIRLRAVLAADESDLTSDFLSTTISVKNQVSGKKVLGTLGAKYMLRGQIQLGAEADILYSSDDIDAAIRGNTTVAFETGMRNSDGQGWWFNIPAGKISGGEESFPAHDLIQKKVTIKGQKSTAFGFVGSFSLFPYLPD